MAIERVVGNGQQKSEQPNTIGLMAEAFSNPTIRHLTPAYPLAREIPPAKGEERNQLLDNASKILTKEGPFTAKDVIHFTDTMLAAARSFRIADDEHVIAVPDRIPDTGIKHMTIHRKEGPEGPSVNIVYQAVDNHKKGDPDRQMPAQTRYVIGENFGTGTFVSTATSLHIGSTETAARPFPYNQKPEATGINLDTPSSERDDQKRRDICTDVYVAHLANAGRIRPDQAGVIREKLHEGTPVSQLEPAK
jgi:hypothetical protein